MTFRSGPYDFSPKEAKRMYAILNNIAQQWDGSTVQSINTSHIQEAEFFVKEFKDRSRYLPTTLPNEFVLVHAPAPLGGDFDDWMQNHREVLDFGKGAHQFPYSSYGAHPRRHLTLWASRVEAGRGCYVYFVPHRTARQRYEPRESRAPFVMYYNYAFPVFQTIELSCLEISRGPYAGQRLHLLFDEPGVFLVKQTFSMQKYEHRRRIVYATWAGHLAPPYGTWRKHVR